MSEKAAPKEAKAETKQGSSKNVTIRNRGLRSVLLLPKNADGKSVSLAGKQRKAFPAAGVSDHMRLQAERGLIEISE